MPEVEPGIGMPPGGAELGADAERELRPEERERRERRAPRTLEIVSHEGADPLAMRRAVRTMLSTMQEGTEKFSHYSIEYLCEALDNRIWNLPEEANRSDEDKEVAKEAEALKAEVTARENLQGAFNNWVQFGGDVGEFSGLFLRTWLKITPTAEDFMVIGNLSETPVRTMPIEEIVERKSEVIEEIEEEKEDRKTGEPVVEVRTRRVTRTQRDVELEGYKGEVKEGEEPLGLKIDKALRTYVNLAVAKAPLWFLKEKVFNKGLSLDKVKEKRDQVRQRLGGLGVSKDKLKELSSLGADEPLGGKITKTREWVRDLVGDKDAEQIAYELFYIMQLATKFGVRVRDRDKEKETEEKYDREIFPKLDREKFGVDEEGKKKPAWKIKGFPASDDLIKLAHVELRRLDEAGQNCKAGPPSTLGCYPDLITDFLTFVKIEDSKDPRPEGSREKVSFFDLWYEKKMYGGKEIKSFGDLPWEEIGRECFDSYLYQRWRANNVLGALVKVTDWELEREVFNSEYWKGLNKDIQTTVGMLEYGSEVNTKHSKKVVKRVIKEMKLNILGGAIISNMPSGFWKEVKANPPDAAKSAQWHARLQLDGKVVKGMLEYTIERSGFLDKEGWEECIDGVVTPRQGIKIEV